MYRLNLFLPWIFLGFVALIAYGIDQFVIVDSKITKMYQLEERESLLNIVSDEKWNWYQRSAALEMAFAIRCKVEDPWIQRVMNSSNINFRQSLMKGCLRKPPNQIPSNLIEQLLQDKYSYIKYRTIQYIENHKLVERYRSSIIKLRKDPSSMVSNLAKNISFSSSE